MILLALLLQVAAPQDIGPDIRVIAPGKPNAQTPATLVIEPAAMFIVGCDDDHDGSTTRHELDVCIERTVAEIPGAIAGGMGYFAFADWAQQWLGDRNALPSPFEIDRDGDNRITLAELQGQFSRLFSRYDKDHDGKVSRADALTVRAIAADAKGPVRGAASPGKRPRAGGEPIPHSQP